jgi:hypothetical protein
MILDAEIAQTIEQMPAPSKLDFIHFPKPLTGNGCGLSDFL